MSKTFIFVFFAAFSGLWGTSILDCAYAQTTLTVNQTAFLLQQGPDEPVQEEELTTLELYRIEKGGKTHLLSHPTYRYGGDCNSEWMEVGNYRVVGNQFLFYTVWDKKGDAPAEPRGFRKQVYEVNDKGQLLPVSNQIWLDNAYGFIGDIALENAASTDPEIREEGEMDIQRVEEAYQGTVLRDAKIRAQVQQEMEAQLAAEIELIKQKLK